MSNCYFHIVEAHRDVEIVEEWGAKNQFIFRTDFYGSYTLRIGQLATGVRLQVVLGLNSKVAVVNLND
jgi:hypothetical protein